MDCCTAVSPALRSRIDHIPTPAAAISMTAIAIQTRVCVAMLLLKIIGVFKSFSCCSARIVPYTAKMRHKPPRVPAII